MDGEYLPIADHGLVGDLHSVALVGTNGTIDWFCCPAFDSPSVFGSLLDASQGGFFALAAAIPARTRQFYLPDTNVLITRFFAEEGVGEIQDFMPLRDPSTGDGQRLIRRVQCVRGTMPFRMLAAPGSTTALIPTSSRRFGMVCSSVRPGCRSIWVPLSPWPVDERDAVTVPGGGDARQLMSTVHFWWDWLSASRANGEQEHLAGELPHCRRPLGGGG